MVRGRENELGQVPRVLRVDGVAAPGLLLREPGAAGSALRSQGHAWMRFHKHRDILMDRNLSIHSRLKFFQAVITPTILFGLPSCPMTKSQISSLDVVQRRMFRNIVGWVRNCDEPWDETMRRIRSKIEIALRKYPIEDWSTQLFLRQFRLAHRVGNRIDSWSARVCKWYPPTSTPGAKISQGRPAERWGDYLRRYACRK